MIDFSSIIGIISLDGFLNELKPFLWAMFQRFTIPMFALTTLGYIAVQKFLFLSAEIESKEMIKSYLKILAYFVGSTMLPLLLIEATNFLVSFLDDGLSVIELFEMMEKVRGNIIDSAHTTANENGGNLLGVLSDKAELYALQAGNGLIFIGVEWALLITGHLAEMFQGLGILLVVFACLFMAPFVYFTSLGVPSGIFRFFLAMLCWIILSNFIPWIFIKGVLGPLAQQSVVLIQTPIEERGREEFLTLLDTFLVSSIIVYCGLTVMEVIFALIAFAIVSGHGHTAALGAGLGATAMYTYSKVKNFMPKANTLKNALTSSKSNPSFGSGRQQQDFANQLTADNQTQPQSPAGATNPQSGRSTKGKAQRRTTFQRRGALAKKARSKQTT